nr:thiamine phosphate synthase [Marinobacter sediminum]
MNKGLKPGLYAVTDSQLTPPESLTASVEAALRGGAVLIQYREKQAAWPERFRQASELQAACRNAGVPLVINDDPELANRVGATGVHLGQSDRSIADARHLLGDEAIIGITCHADLALAASALECGADYLAFGRFYNSATKPDAPAADPAVLTDARHFNRPLTAIGGITIENGEPLIRAGADMLAVIGGLFGGTPEDIEQRAKAFTRLFEQHHPLFSLPR